MTTGTAARADLLESLPATIDGYDIAAERSRYHLIPDAVVRRRRLNRGSAVVAVSADRMETAWHEAVRKRHTDVIVPTTLAPDSPVVELGWPATGPFVRCAAGVYLDLYLGVGQKVLDGGHPKVREAIRRLDELDLLTRREINTDDFLAAADGVEGIRLPQDVATLAGEAAAAAFPKAGPWKCFLSNSGTEAVEAAVKLAWQVRYQRFLEEHGWDTLEAVAKDLGIPRLPEMDFDRARKEPVLADYPFFLVGCWRGFHGRSLGSLHFTTSKKAQRAGYPQVRWIKRVKYNGSPAELEGMIDPRGIREILAAPGGVRGVIEAGRIPRDLFAGFLAEPFQGEGGYLPADPEWFRGIEKVVRANRGLLLVDEVQSAARSGTMFFAEQLGVVPDAVALAKGLVIGITLIRAEHAARLHPGWHSNTWGGGKIFDNQWSWAVLDALLHHRDPVLEGLSYMDNCRVKGRYFAAGLDRLRERHPGMLEGYDQRGLLVGLSVRRRADVIRIGWRRGLKLLGCGPSGDVSRLRLLFLADTLAREIEETLRVLDQVLGEVARTPPAKPG